MKIYNLLIIIVGKCINYFSECRRIRTEVGGRGRHRGQRGGQHRGRDQRRRLRLLFEERERGVIRSQGNRPPSPYSQA